MPQFTVELSWVDLVWIVLWWVTVFLSFHIGRLHPYPQTNSECSEKTEVNEMITELFTAAKGAVLHTTASCTYFTSTKPVAASWCCRCSKHLHGKMS